MKNKLIEMEATDEIKMGCIQSVDWRTGLDWTGLEWNGMEWNGLDWTKIERNSLLSYTKLKSISLCNTGATSVHK